jgi:hypothetical protein
VIFCNYLSLVGSSSVGEPSNENCRNWHSDSDKDQGKLGEPNEERSSRWIGSASAPPSQMLCNNTHSLYCISTFVCYNCIVIDFFQEKRLFTFVFLCGIAKSSFIMPLATGIRGDVGARQNDGALVFHRSTRRRSTSSQRCVCIRRQRYCVRSHNHK